MNKNYKLTFEEKFENGLADWEIKEVDELVLKQKETDEVIPDFVRNNTDVVRADTYVRFSKENVEVCDSKLILKAKKDEIGYCGASVQYHGRKFGKGLIEVKAKLPACMPGIWPKILLNGRNGVAHTDEIFGQIKGINDKGKNSFALFAYYFDQFGEHRNEYLHSGYQRWPSFYPSMDNDEPLSEDWHIFGYEKTDIDAIFYMDGIECFRIDIDHPMFTVFDCEGEIALMLGANLPRTEACNEETKLPCSMEVEYIKFYEEVQ